MRTNSTGSRLQPAACVGDELEARGIGEMQVLERQQQGRPAGRPAQELHDGFAEPGPLQLGIGGAPRVTVGPGPVAGGRDDPGQGCGPGLIRGRQAGGGGQLAQRVGPEGERGHLSRTGGRCGRDGAEPARAGPRTRPACGGLKFLHQAGLADAALAFQQDGRPVPRPRGLPRPGEPGDVGFPPDEPRTRTHRSAGPAPFRRIARRPVRSGRPRRVPDRRDQRRRLRRHRDLQLGGQPLLQLGERFQGRRRITAGEEHPDEVRSGGLVQWAQGGSAAGAGERRGPVAGLAGLRHHVLQGRCNVVLQLVASHHDPVVIKILQQVPAAQGERRPGLTPPDKPPDLMQIHAQVAVGQRHGVAIRDQITAEVRSEGRAKRPDRAAQARPRAGLRNIGPEKPRKPGPRMPPGVEGQPAEERTDPSAGRQFSRYPVQPDIQLADDPDLKHGAVIVGARIPVRQRPEPCPRAPVRCGLSCALTVP